MDLNILNEISNLKKIKNAVILAHNYQIPEVQDIADFIGDSLGLARKAVELESEIIVFCGVHFMAETASILCPNKKILLPDLDAGCSLADSINVEQLKEWKKKNPGAVVVSYVNTTAEIKAESDYCFTSSNAVKIIEAVPENKKILFLPDMFLGAYVQKKTKRKLDIWPGECHVHAAMTYEEIKNLRDDFPDSEVLIHPECACGSEAMYYSEKNNDKEMHFLSTEAMINKSKETDSKNLIVATETGVIHKMKKLSPDKNFIPINRSATCKYMKMITLDKVLSALKNERPEVKVAKDISVKAKTAIDRMVSIG
ncbi:MAG: quinolinate synthase NadA [Thermodesulfobacteriota bacterium]|jgi:quinolinate synthase|nr:quinolinate synthase NadA [bacterium]RZP13139.1 MAG: quinolinate synthase NadA [Candidatus Dadabacteria bacterium]